MLLTLEQVSALINEGKALHIAGAEALLKQLPQGNWIGGSTEYFMTKSGGKISGDLLFVDELCGLEYKISDYDENTIANITADAFDNGFSIVIVPFDSVVHRVYAEKAAEFPDMFIKNIIGWVSGLNLSKEGQTPITANGLQGQVFSDRAVAIHIGVAEDKNVNIGLINIFEQDESSPIIEFDEEGFAVRKCRVAGAEVALADYIAQHNLDTKLPLVGSYSGVGVNISFKSIEDGVVNFYAPVFKGIEYRMALPVTDYAREFAAQLQSFQGAKAAFSCNCVLNFLYGELEGKDIETFFGPITFGEIAYQLLNQTLVYVTVG